MREVSPAPWLSDPKRAADRIDHCLIVPKALGYNTSSRNAARDQCTLDGIYHGWRAADEEQPFVSTNRFKTVVQDSRRQFADQPAPPSWGVGQHVVKVEVKHVLECLDLLTVENLRSHAISVDQPQWMRVMSWL